MKTALILGVTGQDGSHLADILLGKGYDVHGLIRRTSCDNTKNISHHFTNPNFHRWYGDVLDANCIRNLLVKIVPDEIYNEADQDSVGFSHTCPTYQFSITAGFVATLLEAVKQTSPPHNPSRSRIFQPCTAMMFGDAACLPEWTESPQNEKTRFNPQSPYACAKVAAYYLCQHYRNQHGLFVSTGILYNHDSPRRSEHYLLHKIGKYARRTREYGDCYPLALGNLDAVVDIGHAEDYMEAAWLMLQQDKPSDYVIGAGLLYSVKELVDFASKTIKKPIRVVRDEEFYKPSPKSYLAANWRKAQEELGWKPKRTALDILQEIINDG